VTPTANRVAHLVHAIREGDERVVEDAVLRLSRSRRYLAPLAFVVGAFTMLFEGLRLLCTNWRLTLVQVLPAMWIWIATFDLKAHVFHGRGFHPLYGAVLVPVVLAIVAVTATSFFLNAVFAFAVSRPGPPEIRPAFTEAWAHRRVVLSWGAGVGLLLALATTVVTRFGLRWFAIALSIVLGLMMVCYVAVPARLVGVEKRALSTRDRLLNGAVSGALGAAVCAPPYAIARIGLLMLGSQLLFVPGLFVLTLGITLQAGATGSVKAIKMSTKLVGAPPGRAST
jgi:hypothetical protein